MARRERLSVPKPYKPEAHESMMSEMHDALYALSDQARAPMPSNNKLLPSHLQPQKPGMKEARRHIKALHKAFRGAKKEK